MFMILNCTHETNWLQGFSGNFIAPFAVAAVSYYLFGKVDELRKRRNFSRLGVCIIDTLIEEVERGRDSIRNTLDPNNSSFPNYLPRKSWNGINTITDEVLLIILEVTKDIKDEGFPAQEIRIHTKNYFDHIVTNWDQVVDTAKIDPNYKSYFLNLQSYDDAATGVLEMLKHIKKLLQSNSNKIFPK